MLCMGLDWKSKNLNEVLFYVFLRMIRKGADLTVFNTLICEDLEEFLLRFWGVTIVLKSCAQTQDAMTTIA